MFRAVNCTYWEHPDIDGHAWVNLNSSNMPICQLSIKRGIIQNIYTKFLFDFNQVPESYFKVRILTNSNLNANKV